MNDWPHCWEQQTIQTLPFPGTNTPTLTLFGLFLQCLTCFPSCQPELAFDSRSKFLAHSTVTCLFSNEEAEASETK